MEAESKNEYSNSILLKPDHSSGQTSDQPSKPDNSYDNPHEFTGRDPHGTAEDIYSNASFYISPPPSYNFRKSRNLYVPGKSSPFNEEQLMKESEHLFHNRREKCATILVLATCAVVILALGISLGVYFGMKASQTTQLAAQSSINPIVVSSSATTYLPPTLFSVSTLKPSLETSFAAPSYSDSSISSQIDPTPSSLTTVSAVMSSTSAASAQTEAAFSAIGSSLSDSEAASSSGDSTLSGTLASTADSSSLVGSVTSSDAASTGTTSLGF
eukprot:Sdes_comp15605_c0_seq1m4599